MNAMCSAWRISGLPSFEAHPAAALAEVAARLAAREQAVAPPGDVAAVVDDERETTNAHRRAVRQLFQLGHDVAAVGAGLRDVLVGPGRRAQADAALERPRRGDGRARNRRDRNPRRRRSRRTDRADRRDGRSRVAPETAPSGSSDRSRRRGITTSPNRWHMTPARRLTAPSEVVISLRTSGIQARRFGRFGTMNPARLLSKDSATCKPLLQHDQVWALRKPERGRRAVLPVLWDSPGGTTVARGRGGRRAPGVESRNRPPDRAKRARRR